MLKKIAASFVVTMLFVAACAPPEPQAGFTTTKKDATDVEQADETSDEDCEEEAADEPAPSTKAKKTLNAESLPKCACEAGGSARCVPKDQIPASFASQLDSCDDGVCVPDSLVKSGGAAPKTCKSVAGEGRCMSLCVPAVAEKKDVLNRGEGDVCEAEELCVPCLNPLEGNKPTGVCEIGKASTSTPKKCGKSKKTTPTTPSTNDGASCPHQGEPLDVSTFPACGTGGRCVPASAVSEDQRSKLDTCSGGLCAPEKSVAAAGNYLPPTCASVGGAEGRCLSTVIKDIAAKKDVLQQGTCEANELCAPCFDPTNGTDTGACRTVSCDAPKEEAKTFASCCEGKGKCVPSSSVTDPNQKERLDSEGCKEGAELCAPTEDITRTTKRQSCTGSIKLLNTPYQGACVSRCTSLGIKGIFLDQAQCDGDHVCAPCVDPTSGESTGACD